jgi:hypothetical protein
VGVVWGLCSLGLVGAAAGLALAAGAMRAARRGRVRHEFPPIVTPMGYVPTGLLYWVVTGLDLGVLLTAPTFLMIAGGLSPPPAFGLQSVASLVGLGLFIVRA